MAIKWTDDFTVISDMENTTGITAHTLFGGSVSSEATDVINVQGTNSIGMRVNANGAAGLAVDPAGGNVDIRDKHITVWMFSMQDVQNSLNDGVQIGISSVAAATSNVGMATVGGVETTIGPNNNFHSWVIDPNRSFNANVNGTPPALSAVTSFVFLWNFLTNNGRISAFIDQSRFGSTIEIKGGAVDGINHGTVGQVATTDFNNGYGLLQAIGGIGFTVGHVKFGEDLAGPTFNTGTGVNGTTDVITHTAFTFTTGDEFVYNKNGGTAAIGLVDGGFYYLRAITATTVSVHFTVAAAIANTGKINLTSSGTETHEISPNSFFFDVNNAINFDPQRVAGWFHKWSFVGNAGGSNIALFGVPVGTGNDTEGTGGTTLKAGGAIPFRLEAIDANISATFWAVNMQNAPATFFDIINRAFSDDCGTFLDITRDINDVGASDTLPFGGTAAASGDAFYIGYPERFDSIVLIVGVAGAGTYTLSWEYSNGAGWSPLTDFDNNRPDLKAAATASIIFAIPDDWSNGNTVNGTTNKYWIRAVTDGGTRTINTPDISQGLVGVSGGFRMEAASVAAVSGLWENMGCIRIRNGAVLRKIIITSSLAGARNGALDLGSVDPVLDSVRDLTIVKCPKGILLQGTSTGTTPYNLRKITFSGCNEVDQAGVNDSGASFTIVTTQANEDTVDGLVLFPPVPATSDSFYLGDTGRFYEITFNIDTIGVGTYTLAVEYYNGTAYTAVSGLVDNTNSFKTAGKNTVSFTRPTDWMFDDPTASLGSLYHLRFRITGGTMTTVPSGNRVEIPGDVRVDFPAAATIDINILELGSIPMIDNVNGSTVNVIANTQVTFDKMKDNSEVRVYLTATTTELAGIEDATAGTADNRSFAWSASVGTTVDYIIHNFQPGDEIYQTIRVIGFVVPAGDTVIDIAQILDRNAEN